MTWRQLIFLLSIIVAVVAVLRLATGNIIGGVVSAGFALLLWSWAADYPLVKRLRQIWRLFNRRR